jgi:DNA-binding CsgD family transcriptional regulator
VFSCPRLQVSFVEDYSLTAREHQILQLLDKGLTGLAIEHLLGISPRTVAKHLEHVYAKLGVSNRIDGLNQLRGALSV